MLYFYSQKTVRIYNDPQLPSGSSDLSNLKVTVLAIDIPAGNATLVTRFVPQWERELNDPVPPVIDLANWGLSSHELDF
jgi:hypothetical protein